MPLSGFGYRLGWDETEEVPPGHKMVRSCNYVEIMHVTNHLSYQTFRTALSIASNLRLLFTDSTGHKFVTASNELRVRYPCSKLAFSHILH